MIPNTEEDLWQYPIKGEIHRYAGEGDFPSNLPELFQSILGLIATALILIGGVIAFFRPDPLRSNRGH